MKIIMIMSSVLDNAEQGRLYYFNKLIVKKVKRAVWSLHLTPLTMKKGYS
jgi:hypothetical protein